MREVNFTAGGRGVRRAARCARPLEAEHTELLPTRKTLFLLVLGCTLALVIAGAPVSALAASGSAAKPPPRSGALQLVREMPTRELGVKRPATLAWDGRRHALLVRKDDRVVRLGTDGTKRGKTLTRQPAPRPFGSTTVDAWTDRSGVLFGLASGALLRFVDGKLTQTPIRGAAGHDLRGLTGWPGTHLLWTFDQDRRLLLGVTKSGRVARYLDARELGVRNVTGIAVAPSADRTDAPAIRHVYVADAGVGCHPGPHRGGFAGLGGDRGARCHRNSRSLGAHLGVLATQPGSLGHRLPSGQRPALHRRRGGRRDVDLRGQQPVRHHPRGQRDDDRRLPAVVRRAGRGGLQPRQQPSVRHRRRPEGGLRAHDRRRRQVRDGRRHGHALRHQLWRQHRPRGRRLRHCHRLDLDRGRRQHPGVPLPARSGRTVRDLRRRPQQLRCRRVRRPRPRGHGVRPRAGHHSHRRRQIRDDLRDGQDRCAAQHHQHRRAQRHGCGGPRRGAGVVERQPAQLLRRRPRPGQRQPSDRERRHALRVLRDPATDGPPTRHPS